MNLIENSVWNLDINGKPALNELGLLEAKLKDLQTEQKELTRGTKEYAENKAEIKALGAEIAQVRETMGLAGMTVKQLTDYQKALNKEIRDLTPGTDEYIKKTEDLKEVNTRLDGVRKDVRAVAEEGKNTQGIWGDIKGWIVGAFTVSAVFEAARAIGGFVKDSVNEFREFEKGVKDMSAATTITGKDLEFLKSKAKEVGPQMGMTAQEMIAAYKIMGSEKAELVNNAQLLHNVTKEAILLAQTGEAELPEAAKIMANSLNQFGAAATEANKYVNVMAAGVQKGSASITEVGSALKASGTVAAAAGVSFEQTNAIIQNLSGVAIKGEQAGTNLRNMLIKLMSGADDTNPKMVGLTTALDNLGKKNLSTAELAKMFGTENVVAAQHIVKNREEIAKLTTELTGTSAATEMAATRTESLDFKMKQAESQFKAASLELGEKLAPVTLKVIEAITWLAEGFGDVVTDSGPLLNAIGSIFSWAGKLAEQIWVAVKSLLGIDDGAQSTAKFLTYLTQTFAIVSSAIGACITLLQLVIDSLRFLSGKISFDELKNNLVKNVDDIKAGLQDAFVDAPKRLSAEAAKSAGVLSKSAGDARTLEDVKATQTAADEKLKVTKSNISATEKAEADSIKKKMEERIKADKDAQKAIEDAAIKAIKDDEEREIAKLTLSLKRELERVDQSKASTAQKAAWEKALNDQFELDKAKVEETYRVKHLTENEELTKKINKLKTDQITDELTKKKAQLEAELNAELEKNKTAKGDAVLKADYETALREKYKASVEKMEAEYRSKHLKEEEQRLASIKKLEDDQRNYIEKAEYEATRSTLQNKLNKETTNINERKSLKLQLIDLEYEMEMKKIEAIATREKEQAFETSKKLMDLAKDDSTKKHEIEKNLATQLDTINTKLIADKTTLNANYQKEKKEVEQKTLEERKENQSQFFGAIKALMKGDFDTFQNYLNTKLKNDKAANNEQLQDANNKGQAILEGLNMALGAMMQLNTIYRDRKVNLINQERDKQLASWKEQYDKGIINKDQYEKGVDSINKDAANKVKEENLKAWKREQQMQIVMAVIHGAMAALKSLATMGFPLGLIGVAGAAVAVAAQIAMIKRQQPPSMAHGGFVRNAGVPNGPAHGREYGKGGISLVRRDTMEEVGEMEGDEPIMVLSKNTYRNNRRIIDGLLRSSLHQNGAPVQAEKGAVFSDGGTYGDYLKFGKMFQEGLDPRPLYAQYDEDNNNRSNNTGSGGLVDNTSEYYGRSGSGLVDNPSDYYNSSGGYDSGGSSSGYDTGNFDDGGAATMTDAEVQKSQMMMQNIESNTKKTAASLSIIETNTREAVERLNSVVGSLNDAVGKLGEMNGTLYGVRDASNRAADAASNRNDL